MFVVPSNRLAVALISRYMLLNTGKHVLVTDTSDHKFEFMTMISGMISIFFSVL